MKKLNVIFIQIINAQKQKEDMSDIWKNSLYKDLIKLQLNNVGGPQAGGPSDAMGMPDTGSLATV